MLQVVLAVDLVAVVVLVVILQALPIDLVAVEVGAGVLQVGVHLLDLEVRQYQFRAVHQPDPGAQQYQFRAAHLLVIRQGAHFMDQHHRLV